jgi:prephenate dehydratase
MMARALVEKSDRGQGRPAPRVAFQGEFGAYGEEAIERYWKGKAEPSPARSFADVLSQVAAGTAEYGVLPVWNSIIGFVEPSCEALFDARRSAADLPAVVGEVTITVHHCVLGLPGAKLATIRHIGSHRAALAQCGRFFREHPHITPREAYDTAGAARQLAGCRDGQCEVRADVGDGWAAGIPDAMPESLGVIAGAAAARRYGLSVLADDIQDIPDNVTQFFVLTRARGHTRREQH